MEWIEETIKNPDFMEVQSDKRIRKWKKINKWGHPLYKGRGVRSTLLTNNNSEKCRHLYFFIVVGKIS